MTYRVDNSLVFDESKSTNHDVVNNDNILTRDFASSSENNCDDKKTSSMNSDDDDLEVPVTPKDTLVDQTPGDTTKRPSYASNEKLRTSVKLDDTAAEGRPSIYLFIFVNPLSGDRKGSDMVNLPFQHFRLRRFPQVQVEIHNILDNEDRVNGIKNIQLVEAKLNFKQLPPIEDTSSKKNTSSSNSQTSSSNSKNSSSLSKKLSMLTKNKNEDDADEPAQLSEAVKTSQIHVWSAGGDGTVMSVFELLVSNKIDLNQVFFSCIPFGTGNDFSQVLGWGRTIPDKNILGSKLQNLEELICDRLEKSEAARLDIWQIKMTAYPGGYVREAGPKERKDGHDVAEVKEDNPENWEMIRKMSNYMSIGVQGYVGSGFEAHRAGNRLANMFVYAHESSKWVFWKRFPDLSWFIKDITPENGESLYWTSPKQKDKKSNHSTDEAEMVNDPIDLVIQNIPHIWGKEVDLWGEAKSGLESVRNRSGATNPENWKPQRANDGRLEIMSIENMSSYLKKLANIRDHVSRLGQFDSPFSINFRDPDEHKKEMDKVNGRSAWTKTKAFMKDLSRHKYEKKNVICIMCDGEFYEIKNPKSIRFDRFAQIWTLGRNDEENQGRLVKDELDAKNDENPN